MHAAAPATRGRCAVHHRRGHEREQRGSEHHGRNGHVPERHEGEDRDRRACGDRHLRQVLAEEGLQLLHAVDDRLPDCGKFDLKAIDAALDRISGLGNASNALDAWRERRTVGRSHAG